MISYFSLRIFLVCLIACAAMVLIAIWIGKDAALGETYFKTAATLFIVGFAAFSIWFSSMLLAIRQSLQK